jgi:hypothetical protein
MALNDNDLLVSLVCILLAAIDGIEIRDGPKWRGTAIYGCNARSRTCSVNQLWVSTATFDECIQGCQIMRLIRSLHGS